MAALAETGRLMLEALLIYSRIVARTFSWSEFDLSNVFGLLQSWPLSYVTGVAASLAAGSVSLVWWTRERRFRAQREALKRAYQISEEIMAAGSADEILRRIKAVLPKIFGVTRIQIYTHGRGSKTLEPVQPPGEERPPSVSLVSPPSGIQAGAVACFHYRTVLAFPDMTRSPFPLATDGGSSPKSILFVPMFAQNEVVGVFELHQQDQSREFSRDEQALAQHLANQIGVVIKLLDQRAVREQLFRTEKLAAVGQLVSGIVNELQAPLASILGRAEVLAEQQIPGPKRELQAIHADARRAIDIVTRLQGFAGSEQLQAKPIDLNQLLRNLVSFREPEWKVRAIQVADQLSKEPIQVLGSQGQMEQVFLNLLVHAEQALSESPEKTISVRSSLLGKRVLIEIGFSASDNGDFSNFADSAGGALGLGVCRTIVAGHGGELRFVQTPGAGHRFEIELTALMKERPEITQPRAVGAGRVNALTALVIEPDENVQRQLVAMLSAREYRVVPVQNGDAALDLGLRLRFDIALCSMRADGLNWVELSEQLQSRVEAFVLLSDGYNAELTADFSGERRFVLAKPVDEESLETVLNGIRGDAVVARQQV